PKHDQCGAGRRSTAASAAFARGRWNGSKARANASDSGSFARPLICGWTLLVLGPHAPDDLWGDSTYPRSFAIHMGGTFGNRDGSQAGGASGNCRKENFQNSLVSIWVVLPFCNWFLHPRITA